MNDISAPFELQSDRPASGALGLAERGWIADPLLRTAIRRMSRQRLADEHAGGPGAVHARQQELLWQLRHSPIALHTEAANRQHYEIPSAFFDLCLGARRKYSCAFYPTGHESLDEAEEAMLALYGKRAELADGQHILELGCGWGSLTLWMAERFPNSRITAISNSHSQRLAIETRCRERGLSNVTIITGDVNQLHLQDGVFDRCVSVEMFEHVRNYAHLLGRIRHWLTPDGLLFVHIFAHRQLAYPFETEGKDNWMGRHFFTGGLMPSSETLLWFTDDMQVERRWWLDGTHYQRTANHWLANQDRHRNAVHAVLSDCYGPALAPLWAQRWRMFWMACAEMFGIDHGHEWGVAHYRLRPRGARL